MSTTLTTWIKAGLISAVSLFAPTGPVMIALFAMVCVYAFWPRNKETFDRAARLPLDED